jgi:hypothetical protein
MGNVIAEVVEDATGAAFSPRSIADHGFQLLLLVLALSIDGGEVRAAG